jgi:hypothetical protein
LSLTVDGKRVRDMEIALAMDEPGFWVLLDVRESDEKVLTLRADGGRRC